MAVTALDPYSLAFNDFVIGGTTPFRLTLIDGLEALPDMRVQDADQGYNDGQFMGRDFLSGRDITVNLIVVSGNGNTAQQNFALLQAAMLPQSSGTGLLQFRRSSADTIHRMNVRLRKRMVPIDFDYTLGRVRVVLLFRSADPRYYSDTQHSVAMTVAPPLGRTYNRTYNLIYGGGSLGASTTITNSGTWPTQPVITLTGPITNPIVGNLTEGKTLQFNASLKNTDTLVIDLAQRLVTLNGSPARNLLANNSEWFDAQVGANAFYFTGGSTVAGLTSATVVWRDAFV